MTEFRAELHSLQAMIAWIRERTQSLGFSPQDFRKIELALEEALVNVIYHAYKGKPGMIELDCHVSNKKVTFIIKDKGPPFNPLLQSVRIAVPESLEEQKEGGLGIVLIRRYMDEVHYAREDAHNVLTLVKHC